jgi:hypothetical protein
MVPGRAREWTSYFTGIFWFSRDSRDALFRRRTIFFVLGEATIGGFRSSGARLSVNNCIIIMSLEAHSFRAPLLFKTDNFSS